MSKTLHRNRIECEPAISPRRRRALWWVGCCALHLVGKVFSDGLPAYAEGQMAPAEVRAPCVLEVVDPAKTQRLRQEAAAKIPMIYRFESEAVLETEAAFLQTYSLAQDRFWQAMTQAARRPKLDAPTVQHPSFFRFIGWYRQQYPDFPLTTNLARIWALRESDEALRQQWTAPLREVMSQCILPATVEARHPQGSDWVRVVSAPARGQSPTYALVQRDGVTLRASDLLLLREAQARLRTVLSKEPDEVAAFLAGFLRGNVFPEEELTQTIRQQAVKDILALDRYEAGQVIVRKGDRIEGKAKMALDLLRASQETEAASQGARSGSPPATWSGELRQSWKRTVSNPLQLENTALQSLWLLAAVSLLGTGILAWLVRRRRLRRRAMSQPAGRDLAYTVVLNPQQNETVFLPMRSPSGSTESGQDEVSSDESALLASAVASSDRFWQARALEAERRAEEILTKVRAGLAPQLARQMMHRLVQELISQRAQWLQNQRLAEQDLLEIERRFTEAHGQLVDRLLAFEKRTDELEKALAVKAAENSELIKSHIASTQKQIQAKEAAAEMIWN